MIKKMRIETERLIIRPYKEDDLQECFELMQDEELFNYLDMSVMKYEEYKGLFNWLMDSYNHGFETNFKYSFNIVLKETDQHIGWCGLGPLDFDQNRKEIFYLIGRNYWGCGYAKEASTSLLSYAFNTIGLGEVVALCKPENIGSIKVIENMGMNYEYEVSGLPQEYEFYNGEPLYSLTKKEYRNRNN